MIWELVGGTKKKKSPLKHSVKEMHKATDYIIVKAYAYKYCFMTWKNSHNIQKI